MEKIDIVIMWVDGSDQKWIQKRNRYAVDKIKASQYREWGTFKYLFRSIEQNCSWVNNVYLVTDDQVPNFLNLEHPKLKLISHSDFLEKENLPVFNSNSIELNLHRVKGLADQFIYFNDDMFVMNRTEPSDFFKGGLPCDSAIINPIAPSFYNSVAGIMLNNISLINSKISKRYSIRKDIFKWFNIKYGLLNILNLVSIPWSKFTGLYQGHLPSSFLKESFDQAWELYPDVLKATSKNKFRDNFRDVNQWLIKELQVVHGNFSPRSPKIGKYIMIRDIDDAKKAAKLIENSKYKLMCINDHFSEKDSKEISQIVLNSFEKKFPQKSNYEI